MRGGVLRNKLWNLCFFQLLRKSVVPAEGFRRVRLQFSLTLKQETAGTEDNFLVDLAVAANITLILVENRESAYYTVLNNRLLQLEEKIGG